jgi:hypothetical protein
MNILHDQKLSILVALMVLFIVMCAARPAVAEQPLTIDASPCVNIRSAVERLRCYDEAGEPLTIEVSRCVNIKSAIERLTCYDELVDQAQQTRSDLEAADLSERVSDSASDAPVTIIELESVADAAVADAAAAPTAVIPSTPVKEQVPVTEPPIDQTSRVTEENFGLPAEKKQEDEKDLVELHSTISKLREYVPGRYLITLENGQVWRQMVAERYRLRVGHKIRIYPSRWGKSFRLSAEDLKGFIQVERVR